MSFLGERAMPFHFTRARDDELPFDEPLIARGGIVSFASSFSAGADSGLEDDVAFLKRLPRGNCQYGAADMPVQPFVCELAAAKQPSGREVLAALKASHFESEHIHTLDAFSIPFPGYHPDTKNDELHNDVAEQFLFPHPGEGSSEAHDRLRDHVADHHLWYVLLHTAKKPSRAVPNLPAELQKTFWFSDYVILFAVGRSQDRLIGVISHQVCHNLCD